LASDPDLKVRSLSVALVRADLIGHGDTSPRHARSRVAAIRRRSRRPEHGGALKPIGPAKYPGDTRRQQPQFAPCDAAEVALTGNAEIECMAKPPQNKALAAKF
jgi:hypothetical protein